MYRTIVSTLFEPKSDDIKIVVASPTVYVFSGSNDPDILRIDLLTTSNVNLAAGTKILNWSISHEKYVGLFEVQLNIVGTPGERGSQICCRISWDDVIALSPEGQLKAMKLKHIELEEKYRKLEEKHRELEEKYSDIYNRPPEVGGPGYLEAMEDFNTRRQGSK